VTGSTIYCQSNDKREYWLSCVVACTLLAYTYRWNRLVIMIVYKIRRYYITTSVYWPTSLFYRSHWRQTEFTLSPVIGLLPYHQNAVGISLISCIQAEIWLLLKYTTGLWPQCPQSWISAHILVNRYHRSSLISAIRPSWNHKLITISVLSSEASVNTI